MSKTSTKPAAPHASVAPAPASITAMTQGEIEAALDFAEEACRSRGERLTPIRRKVLELLLRSNRAAKAYALLDQMRAIHPAAAPPTVYRALDFLLSVGLIHRIESLNAFAACRDVAHFHHGVFLICQRCGAVTELHEPELEEVMRKRIAAQGYLPAHDCAELKGVCLACQQIETRDARRPGATEPSAARGMN